MTPELEAAFLKAFPASAKKLGPIIVRIAKEQSISPFLISAIASRESLFGATLAKDGTGDKGNGLGIMQLDKRYHAKFAAQLLSDGTPAWRDAYSNITYAVKYVLKPALGFFSVGGENVQVSALRVGTIRTRMKEAKKEIPELVAGVYKDPRPLTGKNLIVAALAAYNGGPGNILQNLALGLPADTTTTAGYGEDTYRRYVEYSAAAGFPVG